MKTKFAVLALAVCLAATMAVAQQVSVNYNHQASFSQYHTYAWGSNNTNQIRNSILAQVAQQDINTAMQGKGFQMVQEGQNPDLILVATGGEREQTSYSAWGMRGIGGGMGGISPEQNVEATMIVNLYDAKTQSLVWRGIAQNTLNNNGNKNQEMVCRRPLRRCSSSGLRIKLCHVGSSRSQVSWVEIRTAATRGLPRLTGLALHGVTANLLI